MATLTIPSDLRVGTRLAYDVLALPDRVPGVYDGDIVQAFTAGPLPEAGFMFSIGWHQDIAAQGWEDLCQMAAILGARLAGEKPAWPSGLAHIRSLPVVQATVDFLVTPEHVSVAEHKGYAVPSVSELCRKIAAGLPEGAVRQQTEALAAQSRLCSRGECDCAASA